MRVGYDGTPIVEPTTGVGQYTIGLWQELVRGVPRIEPVMLLPGPREALGDLPTGEIIIQEPPRRFAAGKARKLWWEQFGLPQALRRARIDLLHAPYHSTLLLPRCPYVMTVHDLVPALFPVYTNSRQMRAYWRLACFAAGRADRILTDSENSAGDIERHLHIPRERIRAVPLAAADCYRPLPPDDPRLADVRRRFGIDGPFMLNVGGVDVRKNLAALIRAFAIARPQLPPNLRLVIGGVAHTDHPDRYPDLAPVAAQAGVTDAVIFTGRVSDEEKLALLNAADLYVYPSLYEGFGIPPLEAMRCGTPTICSDRSSLPEVVGEGGLLVEPTPEKLGAAMAFVLQTPHERRELRRRALAQAAQFSWARTARETAVVYEEAFRSRAAKAGGRKGAVDAAR